MSPDSPTFALHHVRVLEQDGGFSDETDVLIEDADMVEHEGGTLR